jgi:hypothetical protein
MRRPPCLKKTKTWHSCSMMVTMVVRRASRSCWWVSYARRERRPLRKTFHLVSQSLRIAAMPKMRKTQLSVHWLQFKIRANNFAVRYHPIAIQSKDSSRRDLCPGASACCTEEMQRFLSSRSGFAESRRGSPSPQMAAVSGR